MVIKNYTFQFVAASLTVLLILAGSTTNAFHPPSTCAGFQRKQSDPLRFNPSRLSVRFQMNENGINTADPPTVDPQGQQQLVEIVNPMSNTKAFADYKSPLAELPTNKNKEEISWAVMQQRIVRRLNTHEDFMSVHKISAALWLFSLAYIAGVGLSNGFSSIPDSLELATWIALVTSFVQGVTGYDMAVKYRAHDPIVQKGMINTCFQMISSAAAGFYISPFAPEAFNEFHLGNGFLVATIFPSVILGMHEVSKMGQTIKERCLRNKEPSEDFGLVGDLTSYGFVILTGFVLSTIGVIFAANPCHDRGWILDAASSGALSCPNFISENYYASALFNLAIDVGIFAITLRDKKLIPKSVEQTLIAFFNIPAVLLTIHGTPF